MKNLQIFNNIDRKFAIFTKVFSNFLRLFAKGWAKISRNLEVCICMGSGAEHILKRGNWGDYPPNPPEFHPSRKNPPNRKMEKVKGEKFANSHQNPGKWEKKWSKNQFSLRFSNVKLKIFSRKFHVLMVFSPNAQNFAARLLNLL